MENNKKSMKDHLQLDQDKIQRMMTIKLDYLQGRLPIEEAKKKMNASFDQVTPQEFAMCEQLLVQHGITDDELAERMEEILTIFEDVLVTHSIEVPKGHPIHTYLQEVHALRNVLSQMNNQLKKKFIKNEWMQLYEQLLEIQTHFARKQNQLFPALERKGFDKPSKVMWTLDNETKEVIKKAKKYLEEDQDQAFLDIQKEVIDKVEDMMVKEEEILYPTAMDLLTENDFILMRQGDDEIGYCLIEAPPLYGVKQEDLQTPQETTLLQDLAGLLQKHGGVNSSKDTILDVSQGKLTLEQINLIFKHLQVDLSYVDENDIVKFYSDTKHRVFPRSKGVIGREVQNCHPRESVETVEEIIRAFREGSQDQAEFWLEIGGKFIYIIYNAVRDEKGNFRGVLEMMQDVTHIRSLQGSQRLLSWGNNSQSEQNANQSSSSEGNSLQENPYHLTKDTIIGDLVKQYPYIKQFLLSQSPKFKKLENPMLFKTMSSIATLEMISKRGGLDVGTLIDNIVGKIKEEEASQ